MIKAFKDLDFTGTMFSRQIALIRLLLIVVLISVVGRVGELAVENFKGIWLFRKYMGGLQDHTKGSFAQNHGGIKIEQGGWSMGRNKVELGSKDWLWGTNGLWSDGDVGWEIV